jgi:hypothetical protein
VGKSLCLMKPSAADGGPIDDGSRLILDVVADRSVVKLVSPLVGNYIS